MTATRRNARSATTFVLLVATLTATVLAATAPPAVAGTFLNTVEPTADVTGAGHHVVVTLILGCTAGERALFGVTLIQGDVVGTGHVATRCTGDEQHIPLTVAATGSGTFTAGPADVDAWVITRHGQHPDPIHRWSRPGVELQSP